MKTQALYKINSSAKPLINHDNGHLDKFSKRKPTASERLSYQVWRAKLEAGEAIQGVPGIPMNDMPDALAAYRHFMDGSGTKRTISIERYIQNDSSGSTTLKNVAIEAKAAAYNLYLKHHKDKEASFTFSGSKLGGGNGYFPYPKTENWQKTIGAYYFWITGIVDVEITKGIVAFDLIFTFHVEDMYNFNPGALDIATGTPDSANGIFSVTGLAKQYINQGSISRRVEWTGSPAGIHKLKTSNGRRIRRQRQPSDNIRIRNRI